MECPVTAKCPLFRGTLLADKKAQEIYISVYCMAGQRGRSACKRYQVLRRGISPPTDLLPNDKRPIEQIVSEIQDH